MNFSELKDKASRLPLEPGVYIMRDIQDNVIYVGKAKKLKNRVSQYFQDSAAHTPKTRIMVSKIDHFEVFVTASEFEALILECSLIKRYWPKYNILLKDDKGYPYLRLNMGDSYPRLTMVSQIADDGSEYFGPFGSRSVTQNVIDTIKQTFQLPLCSKQFPRDIGKGRPCLHFHMNQCAGWCRSCDLQANYRLAMEQARQLLKGNYKDVAEQIKEQMLRAADDLNFELAASLRDRLASVEALGKKQLVIAGNGADTDVIGYAETNNKACLAILHFKNGNLIEKEYEVFHVPEDRIQAVSSLVKQYYFSSKLIPKQVFLPFEIEDSAVLQEYLQTQGKRSITIKVPQKGHYRSLMELANKNALEEAVSVGTREERIAGSLVTLGKMLSVSTPKRIESFDISNISGTDIVASMVVFQDGKPRKSEYKHFKIQDLDGQDDYASMYQVIFRRFRDYLDNKPGFQILPDLLLIDGGTTHAQTALNALQELSVSIPVLGMVKDDRHRTRSLVTSDGEEISIAGNQGVYTLIGNIQEETHRFAISYHRKLRSKRLRYSELDGIAGIGQVRKKELLKRFGSIAAIKQASLQELQSVLPANASDAVYKHFHSEE